MSREVRKSSPVIRSFFRKPLHRTVCIYRPAERDDGQRLHSLNEGNEGRAANTAQLRGISTINGLMEANMDLMEANMSLMASILVHARARQCKLRIQSLTLKA